MIGAGLWARMSTKQRVIAAVAAGLVACCGGMTGLGAIVGPTPKPAASSAPFDSGEFGESQSTPSPSASASPSPSPTAVETTQPPAPPPQTQPPIAPVQPQVPAPPPPPPADNGGGNNGGGGVYYKNCSEAKAAGAAPLHRGDPGYRSGLDRDGDGVACEK